MWCRFDLTPQPPVHAVNAAARRSPLSPTHCRSRLHPKLRPEVRKAPSLSSSSIAHRSSGDCSPELCPRSPPSPAVPGRCAAAQAALSTPPHRALARKPFCARSRPPEPRIRGAPASLRRAQPRSAGQTAAGHTFFPRSIPSRRIKIQPPTVSRDPVKTGQHHGFEDCQPREN